MTIEAGGSQAALLLRCMAAIAGADGRVAESEVDAISEIFVAMTGRELDVDRLREEVERAWDEGIEPTTLVGSIGAEADLATRQVIAEACYTVLQADGEVTGSEARTFNGIVRALGLSEQRMLQYLEGPEPA